MPRVFLRQDQKVAIATLDPFRREPPKLSAEGGDVPVLHLRRQTQHVKGQDQVVGPQDGFQKSGVGPKTPGRDLAHGGGMLELPDQQLLKPSVAVKAPHRRWSQVQVGHHHAVVGVVLEGEEAG